jgi:class 3 adenylate cyclase/DNA-binding transcriptional MerR regulator
MLSSKAVLEKTGISRATLNNYIQLGILSKPVVSNPGLDSKGPRQLGYFPEDTVQRIESIHQLKKKGCTMSEIAAQLGHYPEQEPTSVQRVASASQQARQVVLEARSRASGGDMRRSDARNPQVTIEALDHPAYMINHNFELIWVNPQARALLPGVDELPADSDARSLLRLLPADSSPWNSLLRFHVALAKGRLSLDSFSQCCRGLEPEAFTRIQAIYTDVFAEPAAAMVAVPVSLPGESGPSASHTAFASYFREGMLIVLQPQTLGNDALLELLSRRDEVIRTLLLKRLPVLTHLAVMVADLQNSVKICAELPPQEYFELINEIWTTMAPIFRRYHATCGKHVGDGLVYYFFPQPDGDYLANALECAQEAQIAMQKLSKSWQIRKNWLNELYLNTGITEGQEWLGTYQSATGIDFVVLGDTINQAARISDVARHGRIWASKSLIGKLSAKGRDRVHYGVHRHAPDGRDHFVASSFTSVSTLLEQEGVRLEKLRDIATLAITEIVSVKSA